MRLIRSVLAAACLACAAVPSLTFYIQRDEYVFQRTAGGWRYLYPRQISIADGGPVRGR
jgi:hypothetical protein